MRPVPIILDTDIGDDIDDALALALALASPEVDLRAVTTVFIDAPRRAALARHLLQLLDRADIPVVAGCSKPLLQPIKTGLGAQFTLEHDTTWEAREHAVDYLVQQVLESDQRITLVPIGPLTNIGLALAREPRLAEKCDIVLMGGQLSCEIAEWNIWGDPEAAAIVFNSGANISMIGLDVTTQCTLSQELINELAPDSDVDVPHPQRAQTFAQLIRLWQGKHSHDLTLHDPLALLTVFLPEVVTWEQRHVEVGLCGDSRGKTLNGEFLPQGTGGENHASTVQTTARVAVAVDAERAVSLFCERVGGLLRA